MQNIIKSAAGASLLLLLGGTALADPSPEIKYLTNEPASMLDVGLIRLRDSLEQLLRFNQQDLGLKKLPSVIPEYDFERNQISIFVSAAEPDFPSPKETCRALVMGVQTWMNASAVWQDGFTHSGYTKNSAQDAAAKAKLPSLVVIQGFVTAEKRGLAGVATCSATLNSPVTYTEPPGATK